MNETTLVATPPAYFWQRRRFWIWSFVPLIVAVVGFVAWLPTTRALVQFHRIGLTMTREEVSDLLGKPTTRISHRVPNPLNGDECHAWLIGEVTFYVNYRNGKVINKSMFTYVPIVRRFFPDLFNRDLL
jgi:hypothetical protein